MRTHVSTRYVANREYTSVEHSNASGSWSHTVVTMLGQLERNGPLKRFITLDLVASTETDSPLVDIGSGSGAGERARVVSISESKTID
jgi:hypothetical protein